MTRTFLLAAAAAAAAALFSTPCAAQIAGSVGGTVGGSVGLPRTAPVTGAVGDTVRGARDMTRDTVRETGDTVRGVRPSADAQVQADGSANARADQNGAGLDAALRTGVMVHSSDGAMLGSVIDVTRDAAGRATAFMVRSADGVVRSVPAGGASVHGDAVVAAWTREEFMARR
jgi:hypothetical protein